MKKTLLFILTALSTGLYAQEHFSGISTSRRVGLLNATINPAELTNMKCDYEINLFNFSANVANNKVSFGDLVGGEDDFEDQIFSGSEPLNMKADVEILGPAFGFKLDKWAFGISTGAKIKAAVIDINTDFGRALTEGDAETIDFIDPLIDANYNQRLASVSWGEIGISAAREIYDSEEHSLSAGVTLKLLFPGSYANMSIGGLQGTLENDGNGDLVLTDASGNMTIAYSGSLAGDFTDSGNYSEFFAGGLNGFGTDIGVNYRWKDINDTTGNTYRLNAGLAVKNLGSMTLKDDNNVSNEYEIVEGQDINLSQFEDVTDLEEIEQILIENGYVTLDQSNKGFKIKMPAVFTAYADVRVLSRLFFTGFVQQKLNEDGKNDQITTQNIVSFIPRYSSRGFEAYIPLTYNEISDFTAGFGLRVGGFFLGSGSILSAALSDTKQADLYLGFRFGW